LVVRPRDERRELEHLLSGSGEEVVADLGMGLHLAPFVGSEPSGFQQDAIRDRDLADVVQGRREAEKLAALLLEADPDREQRAVAADALDVPPRLEVAELRRAREPVDRLL